MAGAEKIAKIWAHTYLENKRKRIKGIVQPFELKDVTRLI
jgi:hypothetical protein